MYLSKVKVKNFRSIKDTELNFIEGKNIIVGRNSAGKSNIFAAIDIVLGENNPTYRTQNITEEDFYFSRDKFTGEFERSDEVYIMCELKKSESDHIDCKSFDSKSCLLPFYGETLGSGKDRKKEFKRIKLLDLNNLNEAFNPIETSFNKVWLSPDEDKYSEIINSASRIVYVFRAKMETNGEITKDMRMLISSDADNSWYLCFRAAIRNELVLSAVLPSFRDPSNQLRLNQYSWFGKLIRSVAVNSEMMETLQEAYTDVNRIANNMFDEFRNEFEREILQKIFPDALMNFQLNADSKNEIYKTLRIFVDDGFKSEISTKGSGFQSTFVINMFKKYADLKSGFSKAILCIEEPELFLHPHARRALSKQIDKFCVSGHQAIITTHSTDFISDIDFGMNIIVCRKTANGTKAKQVSLKDYRSLFVYNYQTEIFFADLVAICEGLESYVIQEVSNYYHGESLDAKNVSVISVQGKDQISEFAKLLYSIGTNCCVICDFDYILRDSSEDRKLYDSKPHKSLESLPEGFFRQYLPMSAGDKIHNRVKRFRSHIKSNNPEAFYKSKKVGELIELEIINEENYRNFQADLNKVGIFILDGEIEDLFTNDEIIKSNGKFTNECLFELHKQLKYGRPIIEFIDTAPIKNSLDKIFSDMV